MKVLFESAGATTPKDIADFTVSSDSLARHYNYEINAGNYDLPKIIEYEAVYSGIAFTFKQNDRDYRAMLTAYVSRETDGDFTISIDDANERTFDTIEQVVAYVNEVVNGSSAE